MTADVTALPFRTGAFDVVVAAFVVNHLPDPVAGLTELRRVTRPGGAVLASTFSVGPGGRQGRGGRGCGGARLRRRPTGTPTCRSARSAVGDPASVERALAAAGFARWSVTEEPVDVGLTEPADVVRYRLALPHLHAFVATLSADARAAFVADAVDAVAATGERFAPRGASRRSPSA